MKVHSTNFISRWLTKLATEIALADYEENHPDILRKIHKRISKYGYPKPESEEDRIIWDVYKKQYDTGS